MNGRRAAVDHVDVVGPGAVVLSPAAAEVLARIVAEHRRLLAVHYPGRVLSPAVAAVVDRFDGLSRVRFVSRDRLAGPVVPVVGSVLENEYVDTATAARHLGITTSGVRRRCYRGQIAGAVLDGGRWLIPRDAIREGTG